MDGNRIYYSQQRLNQDLPINIQGTNSNFLHYFKYFISQFNRENVRIYHKQIAAMVQQGKYCFTLNISDLKQADERLYEKFIIKPLQMLGVMEEGVKTYVIEKKNEFSNYDGESPWQVCVISEDNARNLRNIESHSVNTMFVIGGIIISCTKPYIKASNLKIKCRQCQLGMTVRLLPGENPKFPMKCQGKGKQPKCPVDPYVALPSSDVIDMQSLKIQQNPQEIPTGQIARTYSLISDRYNVNRCVPGDRVRITGVMLVNDLKTDNLSKGIFYITGIQKTKDRTFIQYTTQQEEQFKKLSKDPKLYEKIYKSIAPGIHGSEEIKKAIACMLFGGSRKHLPDGTILRGDINVLLMGDPSTGKSQFLKFVEQTAAIAVYTSGKGSSAAGLTASINRDPATGQFQIEGGALVLADGGIVCIDQFDKMKAADRVAIHEAMQQQTISVAKAGITTRLNSRASILAAANPIYGRINEQKQASEQIELQTTILSRFDCIFIVRDINTNENNEEIVSHILGIHQGKKKTEIEGEISFSFFKKYISYARSKISPRLTPIACDKLQNGYIADRQKAKEKKTLAKNVVPITVRQLQAVIRLSESLAKMRLKTEVTGDDVDEAHYLFEISTMKTLEDKTFGGNLSSATADQLDRISEAIRKKMTSGHQVGYVNLIKSLTSQKCPEKYIQHAIQIMIKNGELKSIRAGQSLLSAR